MKRIIIPLFSFIVIAGIGAFYITRSSSDKQSISVYCNVIKTSNWQLWFREKYPDKLAAWPKEARESFEQIVNEDKGKWNFIWRGDIHENNRPTVLMMKTEDTQTDIIAVKEMKIMDYREGKWVELLRMDYDGIFVNRASKSMYYRGPIRYGYEIHFTASFPFSVNPTLLDYVGNPVASDPPSFDFSPTDDKYTVFG